MRAAEGRARAAEGRINMLEDDLRQAKAQAATEAAARELLQARTEASEAQLGRLEAQALARHRAAHVSELGPKHRGGAGAGAGASGGELRPAELVGPRPWLLSSTSG